MYGRALLLLGTKRNKVLTLEEVWQYGVDSFSVPDYLRIYGMAPAAWYRQGIRLLGRTAAERTRDALAKLFRTPFGRPRKPCPASWERVVGSTRACCMSRQRVDDRKTSGFGKSR
jgi:hypothetical protein